MALWRILVGVLAASRAQGTRVVPGADTVRPALPADVVWGVLGFVPGPPIAAWSADGRSVVILGCVCVGVGGCGGGGVRGGVCGWGCASVRLCGGGLGSSPPRRIGAGLEHQFRGQHRRRKSGTSFRSTCRVPISGEQPGAPTTC